MQTPTPGGVRVRVRSQEHGQEEIEKHCRRRPRRPPLPDPILPIMFLDQRGLSIGIVPRIADLWLPGQASNLSATVLWSTAARRRHPCRYPLRDRF